MLFLCLFIKACLQLTTTIEADKLALKSHFFTFGNVGLIKTYTMHVCCDATPRSIAEFLTGICAVWRNLKVESCPGMDSNLRVTDLETLALPPGPLHLLFTSFS